MNKDLQKENIIVERAKIDPQCFTELYDKYFEAIYRYIARRVNNDQQLTEDLVSQTFCDALANLSKYQFKGYPFSAWLYKIAHNNVLKWYRVNNRTQKVDLEDMPEIKDDIDLVEDSIVLEERDNINYFLDKLEYEEKELIRLKYFEEVSNIEIGNIMGITPNNVGVKLFRALKRLKSLMN